VNVGPTFDDPSGAAVDATQIPKVITWISQNPHIPKPFDTDSDPEETYRKTFLWIVPPNVFKGTITEPAVKPVQPRPPTPPPTTGPLPTPAPSPEPPPERPTPLPPPPQPIEWTPSPPDAPASALKFSGKFPTPSKPDGKDGSELTDDEKKVFIAMLQKEKPAVNKRTAATFGGIRKMIDDYNASLAKHRKKTPPPSKAPHPPMPPPTTAPLPPKPEPPPDR
jgi:hypothetical protein